MNTKSALPIDRVSVRRFLLDRQFLLTNKSPQTYDDAESTLQLIRTLECVQIDPVSAVERNQHLVLAARNPKYKPEYLNQLLSQNKVFEYIAQAACIIPMEDYSIFEPIRARFRAHLQSNIQNMNDVVQNVLLQLRNEGPLPSRAFRSSKRVHGYWDNTTPKTKETSLVLNLLLDVGMIRVVNRKGTERFFDLTEKTIHEDEQRKATTIDKNIAQQALVDKYIRAYRVFDSQDPRFGWCKKTANERRSDIERRVKDGSVIPLQISDVKRQYFIMADDLGRLQQFAQSKESILDEGPIRFLPPLDNLLWRRERIIDFFDFHYKWEIYTPDSKRRYGYYAMPILYGDQLIGRIDPRLDRKNDKLIIRLIQLEHHIQITPQLSSNLREALESFAEFHQAKHILVENTEPESLKRTLI